MSSAYAKHMGILRNLFTGSGVLIKEAINRTTTMGVLAEHMQGICLTYPGSWRYLAWRHPRVTTKRLIALLASAEHMQGVCPAYFSPATISAMLVFCVVGFVIMYMVSICVAYGAIGSGIRAPGCALRMWRRSWGCQCCAYATNMLGMCIRQVGSRVPGHTSGHR